MKNPEPLTPQPPPEESRAEAAERKARASREALRDKGLEYPTRRNGVAAHNLATESVCTEAGVRTHRTKAGRLWIDAWAVAVLSVLTGKVASLKVRVLRHYAEGPEEVRAALLTAYRTGNREALKAMVDPTSWTKGAMQRAAILEERRRRAEARKEHTDALTARCREETARQQELP